MRERYSELSELPIKEQAHLCVKLCNFFSPLNANEMREALGLPINNKVVTPLTVLDFFKYWKGMRVDLWPKMQRIKELIEKLKQRSVLQSRGGVDLNESLLFMKELTEREKKGLLWFGSILGISYIGHEIEKDIVYIEGVTSKEDISVGTGTLVSEDAILTCAHVVNDMKIDHVIIRGDKYRIKNALPHGVLDVAIIFLEKNVEIFVKDLAFRDSKLLEQIIIAGYPKIPRSLEPCYTLQSGEISGHILNTMDKYPMDIFSAIARPGNSGGPVLGIDGCITGIVTRSLERQKEESDQMATLPFFASVPAWEIQRCIGELTNGQVELKWENYA
jgi:hypothetical protein